MDSETDMFMPSQFSSKGSKPRNEGHTYTHVVLFDWADGELDPFSIFDLKQFRDGEIKKDWIEYMLVPQSRCRRIKSLKSMPGKSMSMFGKVEKGVFMLFKFIYIYILLLQVFV